MKKTTIIALICLVVGSLAYCVTRNKLPSSYTEDNRPQFYKETIYIQKKDGSQVAFHVETAKSRRQLAYGLMFKKEIPVNAGMIFMFPKTKETSFWMKNTYIPLDLLFIKNNGEIVQIEHGVPHDKTPIKAKMPIRFVLEINAGQAKAQGVRVGDLLLLNK